MSLKRFEQAEEFLERLGLTEEDIMIYTLLLDSPPLSIGEIQQSLQKLEFLEIGASLRDMQDIGLVKVTKGDYHRYYAVLPWLREAVTVERETIFSLNSLVTSFEEKQEELRQKQEVIENITLPKYMEDMIDTFNQRFHVPISGDLQRIKEVTMEYSVESFRKLELAKDDLRTILTEVSTPVKEIVSAIQTKLVETLHSELAPLMLALKRQRDENESKLKISHKDIQAKMLAMSSALDTFQKQIQKSTEQLGESVKKLQEAIKDLEKKNTEIKEKVKEVDSLKADLQSALIVTRETFVRRIQGEEELSIDDVKEIFDNLLQQVQKAEIKPVGELIDSVQNLASHIDHTVQDIQQAQGKYTEVVSEKVSEGKTTLGKLGKQLATGLSELHVDVISSLEKMEEEVGTKLKEAEKVSGGIAEGLQGSIDTLKDRAIERVDNLFSELDDLERKSFDTISALIDTLSETLKEITESEKEAFITSTNENIARLIKEIHEMQQYYVKLLYERINFAKSMLEGRGADIRDILHMSSNWEIKRPVNTGIVYGLPAIYSTLSDMVLRTRRMVTIVTPKFDEGIFNIAVSMRGKFRTTIVTKFPEKRREKFIEKANDIGTIKLVEYEGEDIIACFRDKEEIVFGYIVRGEDWIAVRSSEDSMISLFEDRFNETVIRRSKRLN